MSPHVPALLHQVHRLAGAGRSETTPDAALVARFVHGHDQGAFRELVERHGPMVLAACRRVLACSQDAEDAFQATFLVLARKASSLHRPESVGAWLHGVAVRVSRKARARRRSSASLTDDLPDPRPGPLDALGWRELLALIDEEVLRLPEVYRLPIVLCYLQGSTAEAAARQLGWTVGSVRGRLERARTRLQERLARRGLAVPAALVAIAGGAQAQVALAARLIDSATSLAAGAAPRVVAALAAAVAPAGAALRLGLAVFVALAAGLIAFAAGEPAAPPVPPPTAPPPAAPRAHVDALGDPLPAGAIARLGTVRLRHSYTTGGLAWSPDGKFLATIGANSTGRRLVLWDAGSGKELFDLTAVGSVMDASFSADGKVLRAVTFDKGAVLYDTSTGKERGALPALGPCTCAAFSPDGKALAVSGKSGVRLLRTDTGEELRDLGADSAGAIAFAPDGKSFATGHESEDVIAWDTASGKEQWRLPAGKAGPYPRVAFSPDGGSLATGSQAGLRLWDVATRKERVALEGAERLNVLGLAFTPDGRALAAASGRWVQVWDTRTGKERRHIDAFAFGSSSVAFSPDGKTLAAAAFSHSAVQLIDLASGKERGPEEGHIGAVTMLRFSGDGKSLTSLGRDQRGYVWGVASGRGERRRAGPAEGGWAVHALSPDGRTLAAARGNEGHVRLWDFATGKELDGLGKHAREVYALVFSPDGKVLVTAGADKALVLWDVPGRRELRRIKGLVRPPSALAFSPDGRLLATGPDQPTFGAAIQVWDVAAGEEVTRLDGPGWFCVLAFSPDGSLLAAGGYDGSESRSLVRPVEGRFVWAWDTSTWRQRHKLPCTTGGNPEDRGTLSLAFSPGSRYLAVGGVGDSTVRVFDLVSDREVRHLKGHHSGVTALAFAPDGRTLASGGGDSTILIWELRPPRPSR